MIRFSCAACGGKFKAKYQHAGRQTKCPNCGAPVVVPLQDAWEEDDAPSPPPMPRKPTRAAVAPTAQWPPDDEPVPYRPPAKTGKVKKRPSWKNPVVIIGAIPVLVLTAFAGYLYLDHAEKEFEGRVVALKAEADRLARSRQPQSAIQKHEAILAMVREKWLRNAQDQFTITTAERSINDLRAHMAAAEEREDKKRREQEQRTQAEAEERVAEEKAKREPEEPFRVSEEAMPGVVEDYLRFYIAANCEGVDTVDEANIQAIEVRRAPPDPRKIPWLWYATATIAVKYKPSRPGVAPRHLAMAWKVLYQFTPEGRGAESWREVTIVSDGSRVRRHFDLSEWTPEFRARVSEVWLKMFQDFNEKDNSETESERRETLQSYKESVARSLEITMEELDEILASPGPLPRVAAKQKGLRAEDVKSLPPAIPENPPTLEERVFAEGKEMWADANRRAQTMARHGKWNGGLKRAEDFLRRRKQEIITELAQKYGLNREKVKDIVMP